MLDQVVMNLCVNARDAMPSGGQLTLEARLVKFDPDSAKLDAEARPGWFACLRVSDTGTGMSPEVLAHVFEPFYTTKEAGKGTGLGLATVHGIVHQHNGWINVESAVGQGTTFRIYLPLSTRAAPAERVAAPGAIPRGAETILLVEDEESVRRVTSKMLERLGYRVLVAGGGQEALQLWKRHMAEIDLLFSDMVMPNGISGLDLAQKLQQAKPALKVIIVSGYSRDIVSNDALRASGIVFLGKPFESTTLATALRECLA
jgi:CheY-like chemotaxis protein